MRPGQQGERQISRIASLAAWRNERKRGSDVSHCDVWCGRPGSPGPRCRRVAQLARRRRRHPRGVVQLQIAVRDHRAQVSLHANGFTEPEFLPIEAAAAWNDSAVTVEHAMIGRRQVVWRTIQRRGFACRGVGQDHKQHSRGGQRHRSNTTAMSSRYPITKAYHAIGFSDNPHLAATRAGEWPVSVRRQAFVPLRGLGGGGYTEAVDRVPAGTCQS